MAVIVGKAPGKIILFGEHAVVYAQPAIAIPVDKVKATARVFPDFYAKPGSIRIQAQDIGLDEDLSALDRNHPLAAAVFFTLETLQPENIPAFVLQISSTIPIAAGMGSGAAVAVAIIRAVSSFLGKPLPDSTVTEISYEVERIHHGTPSGIDNNVVTYGKPVFFLRGEPIRFLEIQEPTHWVIADTGEKTPTFETVADIRKRQSAEPYFYHKLFENIGELTRKAERALINGNISELGKLLDKNQRFLEKLDVSSPAIEKLVQSAKEAGAAGAKLSGGGRGGNIITLASSTNIDIIKSSLVEAGAVNVISTKLGKDTG